MEVLLIVCVSHHPILFDKGHNYKDNGLTDNVWSSIAEHLGYQDSE